jgi:methylmalonyl-CoA mutase
MGEVLDVVKAAGYDLVIAETAGIGQGDSTSSTWWTSPCTS